jgi:branched-chain amino acid transport system permease protein
MIAGFFAGIGGALAALNFEIVTSENVSGPRSGVFLLFTFLGGATFFFGAIIGGILSVLAFVLFSELTKAWLLYLGLLFLFMVMYAPGGFASLIMMNFRVVAYGKFKPLIGKYCLLFASGSIALLGLAAMVEMVYHMQLNQALGAGLTFLNIGLNVKSATSWGGAVAVMLAGSLVFELTRRKFAIQWSTIQEFIENEIKRKESL